ncbi:MAG: ribonuclease HII [Deltaproteobacteria bacterium]|nr:ribonuclease HII [Deltaproteobacteria bacterium]
MKAQFRAKDNFHTERYLYCHGYHMVAGCDEVGRGSLAGPVVAACVILPQDCDHSLFLDSKKLSILRRIALNRTLQKIGAIVAIGQVSEKKIDTINILQASLLAMKRGADDLAKRGFKPDFLLIDGKFTIPLSTPQQALVRGESKSGSIAAASIAAKVARDLIMEDLHERYPVYNFRQNKGYPTKEHRQALLTYGPSPVHRYSFKGVKRHG